MWLASAAGLAGDFVHYESSHVHPLGLSEAGDRLFAVNTPEARLAIFAVTEDGDLAFEGDVPVGLEPVSLAVRPGTSEVWVVNHLSDSVSVVDVAQRKLLTTLAVGDEPTDVVFAGERAFVSLSGRADRVVVYAAQTRKRVASLEIFSSDPRALAATPDGKRVVLVALESGNRTTSVAARDVLAGGGAPPPDPPRDVIFPPSVEPRPALTTPLIVQFDTSAGKWLDEVGGDWSPRVFGGVPLELPDYDLFVIDAESEPPAMLARVSGVGTSLFDVAIHPVTGDAWVPNTEARNLTRFEPNLRGHLVETRLSIVSPDGAGVTPVDLNPHIDRSVTPGPPEEIALSLAIPGDGAFRADGSAYYLTAFGSGVVAVLDGVSAAVTDRIAVNGGPSGLALHEGVGRLYVMQRFANAIAIVDTERGVQVGSIGVAGPAAFDPSPPEVRHGRRFLYDAQLSSGHGDLACATCHLFANFDGLAWDLGDPQGEFVAYSDVSWLDGFVGGRRPGWDPMKGPMRTQTLRGMRGQEPFHWRADRRNFQHFDQAFDSLLGRDGPLSAADMDAFTAFIMTVELPPNPYRNLDDTLPSSIEGHGDPSHGKTLFETRRLSRNLSRCPDCHFRPSGSSNQIRVMGGQDFKVADLRNVYEKLNRDRFDPSEAPLLQRKGGFGVLHHGATAFNVFVALVAPLVGEELPDLRAFLISFPTGTPPCVGRQLSVDADGHADAAAAVGALIREADAGRCDLIAKGVRGDTAVGYVYDPLAAAFVADSVAEPPRAESELRAALGPGDVLTYTAVPRGSGRRLGIDRDRDDCLDRDELLQRTDPANPGAARSDSDRDGIPDDSDLCPDWVQLDAEQTDSDGDGIPDECDRRGPKPKDRPKKPPGKRVSPAPTSPTTRLCVDLV